MQLTLDVYEKWLRLFAKKVESNKLYLSELDAAIGDGDHRDLHTAYRRQRQMCIRDRSKDLCNELLTKLDESLHLDSNKKYSLLINGMGATPLMEQYIFSNDVLNWLEQKNIKPAFMKVGNYMTSIDMAGISVTLFELADDKWLDYLNMPVETVAW